MTLNQQPSTLHPASRRKAALHLLAGVALLAVTPFANAQTVLPTNVQPTCTVTPIQFAGWFVTGTVTANGSVDPANSLTFPNQGNCSFYQWSEQMFLWLTSTAPAKYGAGGFVFDSPVFYDVSPVDPATGKRTLIPNAPGQLRSFAPNISQLGPNNKPVVFDQTGKMFTVVRPEISLNGKTLIRNKVNQALEIARTEVGRDGKPVFLDSAGKAIDFKAAANGNPQLRDRSGKLLTLRLSKTLINGKPFFIDPAGNAVPTEQGQADGNVLMSQNGSLVYYALQVNDVYAYFLTGQKDGKISATTFPATPAALVSIEAFGLANAKIFPDADAMAIEVKSAWIETTGLDTSKYLTITATIPTYNKVSATQWNVSGSRPAQLALVGMHVVGSASGHPEMIWASFEHVNNTRNAQYSYKTNASPPVTVTVPQDNAGIWTFSSTPPAASGPNLSRMEMSGTNIVATASQTIGASDILRVNPWGMVGSNAVSNTEVLSINNSVIGQLLTGDMRKNYFMIGATWTKGGAPPNSQNQVGTSQMANSTMESTFQPSNCFDCHTGNMLGTPGGGGLSHIWGPSKPLF